MTDLVRPAKTENMWAGWNVLTEGLVQRQKI